VCSNPTAVPHTSKRYSVLRSHTQDAEISANFPKKFGNYRAGPRLLPQVLCMVTNEENNHHAGYRVDDPAIRSTSDRPRPIYARTPGKPSITSSSATPERFRPQATQARLHPRLPCLDKSTKQTEGTSLRVQKANCLKVVDTFGADRKCLLSRRALST